MRIKETTVYQFDELSDKAKEKARDWFRESAQGDNYFTEAVIEDAVEIGRMLGIDFKSRQVPLMSGKTRAEPAIFWSGFSSQGDGASFEGSYAYKADAVEKIAQHAPEGTDKGFEQNNEINSIARDLAAVGEVSARIVQRGNYTHSHTMEIEVYNGEGDEAGEDHAEATRVALRDFADWIYRGLEREYEYRMSDEAVDEDIRANEYEFTEDGRLI